MTLNRLAALALAGAGVVHLGIAPGHYAHAPAHGVFFALVGAAQVGWALLFWWRPHPALALPGAALSGGVVALWALTQAARTPFAAHTDPVDLAALVTKAAELAALAAVILAARRRLALARWRLLVIEAALLSFGLMLGVWTWAVALIAESFLPQLAAGDVHGGASAAYIIIRNTGEAADTLVGASAEGIGRVEIHQTVAEDAAAMQQDEGIAIGPGATVVMAPGGMHLMLIDVARDLAEGEAFALRLRFASGREATVPVTVRRTPPVGMTSAVQVGDLVVENAWAEPVGAALTAHDGAATQFEAFTPADTGEYAWNLPPGFPLPRVPADNPMTAAKVELGRYLFYDPRLSGNGAQACSSCHLQARAFTDGRARAVGSTGQAHPRNTLTLTNSAYSATLTWGNPVLDTLERQIPIPMFGEFPVELGVTGHEDTVLARFRDDPLYQELFAAAFPDDADPIGFGNINKALASFVRTLISGNSAYDRYVYQGDRDALSESALRGMELFLSERLECHHCHGGFNFTLSTVHASTTFVERPFHNTGLYNIDGAGAYPPGNTGVHEITSRPEDMGKFRAPTLRNVALTAPYMHDGSIATLEEVIRFYEQGGRVIETGEYAGDGRANPYKSALVPGFELTDQERADLLTFLKSLTDTEFIANPRFSNPFAAP